MCRLLRPHFAKITTLRLRLACSDGRPLRRTGFKRSLNSTEPGTGRAVAEVAVNPPDPKSGGAAAIADAGITNAACPFAIRKLSGEAAEMLQLVRTNRLPPQHTPLLSPSGL